MSSHIQGFEFDAEIFHRDPYVYYLCLGDEVVYVGQSYNVLSRLAAHTARNSGKAFDRVLYRRCKSHQEMYELERSEIERLNPVLNVRHRVEHGDWSEWSAFSVTGGRPKCALCGAVQSRRFVGSLDDDGNRIALCCSSKRDCFMDWTARGFRPGGRIVSRRSQPLGDTSAKIVEWVRQQTDSVSAADVAQALHLRVDLTKDYLARLARQDRLRRTTRGRYTIGTRKIPTYQTPGEINV